jgi:hypothetical protein
MEHDTTQPLTAKDLRQLGASAISLLQEAVGINTPYREALKEWDAMTPEQRCRTSARRSFLGAVHDMWIPSAVTPSLIRILTALVTFTIGCASYGLLHLQGSVQRQVAETEQVEQSNCYNCGSEDVRYSCVERASAKLALAEIRRHRKGYELVDFGDVVNLTGEKVGERRLWLHNDEVWSQAIIQWNVGSHLFSVYTDTLQMALVETRHVKESLTSPCNFTEESIGRSRLH